MILLLKIFFINLLIHMLFTSRNKAPFHLAPLWATALLMAVLVGFVPGTLERADGSVLKTENTRKLESHKPVLRSIDCIRHESKCHLLREQLEIIKSQSSACCCDRVDTSLDIFHRASLLYLAPSQIHSREFLNLSILGSKNHPPTV